MLSFNKIFFRLAFAVVPVLLAVLHVTGWVRLPPLEWVDHLIYDTRLRATMPRTLDDRIVIVDIDEPSLAEQGRWPWRRDKVAQLVQRLLNDQRAAAVGFDVVFAEPESDMFPRWLQRVAERDLAAWPEAGARIQALLPQLDGDAALARALADQPVVLGHYFSSDRGAHRSGQLPQPVFGTDAAQVGQVPFIRWTGYGANLPVFMAQARDGGFFNALPDDDGVIRSVPLLSVIDGQVHQSFALAVLRALLGHSTVEPVLPQMGGLLQLYGGLEGVRIQQGDRAMVIPVDQRVSTLVPYRGLGGPSGGSFRYVSATDVMEGRLPSGGLAGKVVLVGTTVPGLWDVRVTPVGPAYPGVEVHANLLAGFMDGTVPIQPDYAMGYELTLVLVSGLLLAVLLPRLAAWPAVVFLGGLLGTLVGLNTWLYATHHLVLPLAASLFMVLTAFVLNMSYGYVAETRAKRHLAGLFGTYVPPELVEKMVQSPETYTMQAQEREVTVLFCDIRGFTTMAEKMSPDQIQSVLNHVLSELSAVVRQHGGTIDKFIGDCIMAFWGAPLDDSKHAEHAVAAALDMVKAMVRINAHGAQKGWPEVSVGIGINTGRASVGDMGSDDRRAYTVVGDVVNVASRLEALTRDLGVNVLVGESTSRGCEAAQWLELERVQVKGKTRKLAVFTPLHPR